MAEFADCCELKPATAGVRFRPVIGVRDRELMLSQIDLALVAATTTLLALLPLLLRDFSAALAGWRRLLRWAPRPMR